MVRSFCKNGKHTYVLSASTISSEDSGPLTMYGITIIGDNETFSAEDISDDYSFVRHLFDLIVEEELYPEHLYDVVEDYLSSGYPAAMPNVSENSEPDNT